MGEWQHGLFGCFSNIGLCCFTWFVPCYTHGKTAEVVGDDCLLCGLSLFVPLLNLYTVTVVRGKVRESKSIDGSLVSDCLVSMCCFACVLVQSAQEAGAVTPIGAGESMGRS